MDKDYTEDNEDAIKWAVSEIENFRRESRGTVQCHRIAYIECELRDVLRGLWKRKKDSIPRTY